MNHVVNPYKVRRAAPEDTEALTSLVPLIVAETSLLPPSMEKIGRLIDRCVNMRGGAIAGVIDGPSGVIDASVGLAFTQDEVSDEPYITAVWFGLHPAARKRVSRDQEDPRAHYGRKLFEFTKWAHAALEGAAGKPILMRFDLLTATDLGPKMGLYQRHAKQVGGIFALGALGEFRPQVEFAVEEAAA